MAVTENPRGLPRALPLPGRTFREKAAAFVRAPLRGKMRRWYLATFRKSYVQDQQRLRQGQCRQCGSCCRLAYRCMFLDGENSCRIYDRKRHPNCVVFPVDNRDIEEVSRLCGFRFGDVKKVREGAGGEDRDR